MPTYENLYDHQKDILEKNPHRWGIFHDVGLGKTITALELAKKNNVTALIIVPKALKKQWEGYIELYNPQHHVITKETFRRDWNVLPHYDAVIIDEAQHMTNVRSKLTKSLLAYLTKHDVQYRWLLTGTPYRREPLNIYALGVLLGKKWNYWSFFKEFYNQIDMGGRMIPVVKKNIDEKLNQYVQQIGSTLAMGTVFDVPTQHYLPETVELTTEQKKAIKDLDETLAISRFTKLHSIENGFLYGDGYVEDVTYGNNKNERIKEIIRDKDKVIIVGRYTRQLAIIKEELSRCFPDRPLFEINGSVPDRHAVITEANKVPRGIVLIQAQCSEGYELPTYDTMIFASLSFSHVDHIQMKGRILRVNALKENYYHYLVCHGVDKMVYKSIMSKKDFHENLYK